MTINFSINDILHQDLPKLNCRFCVGMGRVGAGKRLFLAGLCEACTCGRRRGVDLANCFKINEKLYVDMCYMYTCMMYVNHMYVTALSKGT